MKHHQQVKKTAQGKVPPPPVLQQRGKKMEGPAAQRGPSTEVTKMKQREGRRCRRRRRLQSKAPLPLPPGAMVGIHGG
ncbi:hypothetical protein GUJ93_ZPchr0010g8268 [Zizania palustris]|uniref:Uncharacterized protein n=1 Tax=Zizania palustris TaxID=103762 RepID=A0A8J5T9N3_ZIZPA|nr:hypothetical protein GUJ93_ZPchr0010g8268 [Zizania palustris]